MSANRSCMGIIMNGDRKGQLCGKKVHSGNGIDRCGFHIPHPEKMRRRKLKNHVEEPTQKDNKRSQSQTSTPNAREKRQQKPPPPKYASSATSSDNKTPSCPCQKYKYADTITSIFEQETKNMKTKSEWRKLIRKWHPDKNIECKRCSGICRVLIENMPKE